MHKTELMMRGLHYEDRGYDDLKGAIHPQEDGYTLHVLIGEHTETLGELRTLLNRSANLSEKQWLLLRLYERWQKLGLQLKFHKLPMNYGLSEADEIELQKTLEIDLGFEKSGVPLLICSDFQFHGLAMSLCRAWQERHKREMGCSADNGAFLYILEMPILEVEPESQSLISNKFHDIYYAHYVLTLPGTMAEGCSKMEAQPELSGVSWQLYEYLDCIEGTISAIHYEVERYWTDSERRCSRFYGKKPLLLGESRLAQSTPLFINLFERRAKQNPKKVAVWADNQSVRFEELDDAADLVAQRLLDFLEKTDKASADDNTPVVALCFRPSIEAIVALLGVLKAGMAFSFIEVPGKDFQASLTTLSVINPDYLIYSPAQGLPHGFISVLSKNLGILAIESIAKLKEKAKATPKQKSLKSSSRRLNDLAYMAHSSGSSGGKPKVGSMRHTGLYNILAELRDVMQIDSCSVVAHESYLQFDAALTELLVPLMVGAQIVIVPAEKRLGNMKEHAKYYNPELNNYQHPAPTAAFFIPSVVESLKFESSDYPQLKTVLFTGEALSESLAEKWYFLDSSSEMKTRTIVNGYGPMEVTIGATLGVYHPKGQGVPIGQAIRGVGILLCKSKALSALLKGEEFENNLDDPEAFPKRVELVSAGQEGELYLYGPALGGYRNQAESLSYEERQRFRVVDMVLENKSIHVRIYQTGDRGQWQAGSLYCYGRIDASRQGKLNGVLIRSFDIEALLNKHPAVQLAYVDVSGVGKREIKAYLQVKTLAEISEWVEQFAIDITNEEVNNVPWYKNQALKEQFLKSLGKIFISQHGGWMLVPSHYSLMSEWPSLPSKKTNIKALKERSCERFLGVLANEDIALNPMQRKVIACFEAILESCKGRVSLDETFPSLGGSSFEFYPLLAALENILRLQLEDKFPANFTLRTRLSIYDSVEKIAQQLMIIQEQFSGEIKHWCKKIKDASSDTKAYPRFLIHPLTGETDFYQYLSDSESEAALYTIKAPGRVNQHFYIDDIPAMAAIYIQAVQVYHPQGPYFLGGFSLGGVIAYEMACQLKEKGQEVHVFAIDSRSPTSYACIGEQETKAVLAFLHEKSFPGVKRLIDKHTQNPKAMIERFIAECKQKIQANNETEEKKKNALAYFQTLHGTLMAILRYRPKFREDVSLTLLACENSDEVFGKYLGWGEHSWINYSVCLKGGHFDCFGKKYQGNKGKIAEFYARDTKTYQELLTRHLEWQKGEANLREKLNAGCIDPAKAIRACLSEYAMMSGAHATKIGHGEKIENAKKLLIEFAGLVALNSWLLKQALPLQAIINLGKAFYENTYPNLVTQWFETGILILATSEFAHQGKVFDCRYYLMQEYIKTKIDRQISVYQAKREKIPLHYEAICVPCCTDERNYCFKDLPLEHLCALVQKRVEYEGSKKDQLILSAINRATQAWNRYLEQNEHPLLLLSTPHDGNSLRMAVVLSILSQAYTLEQRHEKAERENVFETLVRRLLGIEEDRIIALLRQILSKYDGTLDFLTAPIAACQWLYDCLSSKSAEQIVKTLISLYDQDEALKILIDQYLDQVECKSAWHNPNHNQLQVINRALYGGLISLKDEPTQWELRTRKNQLEQEALCYLIKISIELYTLNDYVKARGDVPNNFTLIGECCSGKTSDFLVQLVYERAQDHYRFRLRANDIPKQTHQAIARTKIALSCAYLGWNLPKGHISFTAERREGEASTASLAFQPHFIELNLLKPSNSEDPIEYALTGLDQAKLSEKSSIQLSQIFASSQPNTQAPKRLWLWGHPGSGKSTLLCYLAYQNTLVLANNFAQQKLNIYLPLAKLKDMDFDFDGKSDELSAAIKKIPVNGSKRRKYHHLFKFIEYCLTECSDIFVRTVESLNEVMLGLLELCQAGRVCLLLDGLDEVINLLVDKPEDSADKKRANLLNFCCKELHNDTNLKVVTVLSSRCLKPIREYLGDHREEKDARVIMVVGFNEAGIEAFVSHFSKRMHELSNNITLTQKNSFSTHFVTELKRDPSLWLLAHTPMTLYMLCDLRRRSLLNLDQEDITLASVYKRFFGARKKLLAEVLKKEGIKASTAALIEEKSEAFLSQLALTCLLQTQDSEMLLSSEYIEALLTNISKTSKSKSCVCINEDETIFLNRLQGLGILLKTGSRNKAKIGFYHRSFAEYLVAKAVAKNWIASVSYEEKAKSLIYLKSAKKRTWRQLFLLKSAKKAVCVQKTSVSTLLKKYRSNKGFELIWVLTAGLLDIYVKKAQRKSSSQHKQLFTEKTPLIGNNFHPEQQVQQDFWVEMGITAEIKEKLVELLRSEFGAAFIDEGLNIVPDDSMHQLLSDWVMEINTSLMPALAHDELLFESLKYAYSCSRALFNEQQVNEKVRQCLDALSARARKELEVTRSKQLQPSQELSDDCEENDAELQALMPEENEFDKNTYSKSVIIQVGQACRDKLSKVTHKIENRRDFCKKGCNFEGEGEACNLLCSLASIPFAIVSAIVIYKLFYYEVNFPESDSPVFTLTPPPSDKVEGAEVVIFYLLVAFLFFLIFFGFLFGYGLASIIYSCFYKLSEYQYTFQHISLVRKVRSRIALYKVLIKDEDDVLKSNRLFTDEKLMIVKIIIILPIYFFLTVLCTALALFMGVSLAGDDPENVIGKERLRVVQILGYATLAMIIVFLGICCLALFLSCCLILVSSYQADSVNNNNRREVLMLSGEGWLPISEVEFCHSQSNLLGLSLYGQGLFEIIASALNKGLSNRNTIAEWVRSQVLSYLKQLPRSLTDELNLQAQANLRQYLYQNNKSTFRTEKQCVLEGPILLYGTDKQNQNAYSYQKYCQLLEQPNTWGSQVELMAFLLQEEMSLVLRVKQWGTPERLYCVLTNEPWSVDKLLVLTYEWGRYAVDESLSQAVKNCFQVAEQCQMTLKKNFEEKFAQEETIIFMNLNGNILSSVKLNNPNVSCSKSTLESMSQGLFSANDCSLTTAAEKSLKNDNFLQSIADVSAKPKRLRKINTLGDGNCAFNAVALGLCRLAQRGQLSSRFLRYPKGNINIYDWLSDKLGFKANGLQGLQNWIDMHSDVECQKVLAPHLRILAVDYIESCYDEIFASIYEENLVNVHEVHYPQRALNSHYLDPNHFLAHSAILKKIEEIANRQKRSSNLFSLFKSKKGKDDLLTWWRSEGKTIYFNTMREVQGDEAQWGGQQELGALAYCLNININWRKVETQTNQLGIGAGILYLGNNEQDNVITQAEANILINLNVIEAFGKAYYKIVKNNLDNIKSLAENDKKIIDQVLNAAEDSNLQLPADKQAFGGNLCHMLYKRGIVTHRDNQYRWISKEEGGITVIDREAIAQRMEDLPLTLVNKVRNACQGEVPEIYLVLSSGHWSCEEEEIEEVFHPLGT